MKIPLLGISMRNAGYIAIDRKNPKNAIKSMNKAAIRIRNGASVLVFPEGTRSPDGNLQSFKKGAFHLALKSGCDIIPVAVVGSNLIAPKGRLRIKKGKITINIGAPIPIKEYSKTEMNKLISKAYDTISNLLNCNH